MMKLKGMLKSRRLLLQAAIAAIAAGSGTLAAPALGQEVELKLGHVGEPGSIFQISADEFAKRVNAKLAGNSTYHRWVPAFLALYEREGRDFAAFYRAAAPVGGGPPNTSQGGLQTCGPCECCLPTTIG